MDLYYTGTQLHPPSSSMLCACLTSSRHNRRLSVCADSISELGGWFYTLAVYNLLLELTGNSQEKSS
jgi:hypothetical protein